MNIYKILSVLLCYPEAELVEALPAIREQLENAPFDVSPLEPLLERMAVSDLICLQEDYVQTFDRNPAHALHLFEHIHGEDRARGGAMINLIEEYKKLGLDLDVSAELPDYLPLFLEFLSLCKKEEADEFLDGAIDVISHIGQKLKKNGSVYSGVFQLLEALSPREARPLQTAPIRDMDEALEKFGPTAEGVEPLLQSNTCIGCQSHKDERGTEHGLPR